MGRTGLGIVAAALLAACGKDEGGTDGGDGCDTADVIVTVTDQAGAPVEGALVELDDQACLEGDPGVYTCAVPSGADYNVYVTDARFTTFAQTVEVPADACEVPFSAVLSPDIAY